MVFSLSRKTRNMSSSNHDLLNIYVGYFSFVFHSKEWRTTEGNELSMYVNIFICFSYDEKLTQIYLNKNM